MEILGKTAIWLAMAGTGTSLIFYLAGKRHTARARWAFRGAAFCITLAITLLLTALLTHRFEFTYVAGYSSRDLPLYYLIATLWGGQEGTLLLWIFYTGIMGLFVVRRLGVLERAAMVTINLFIAAILLILLKRSPFATTAFAPADGQGLNPLLQDFWMTIHPPIMFFGFATALFPFAIAVAGWWRRDFKQWMSAAWVWLLLCWSALGTALVMGGYWAYKVLGWGGYWAWDPVENSSLIPWIFATGGVHAMIMHRKKKALGRTAYLAVVLTWTSVLFGSFLTRSGVLGDFSVHSFLDLGINSYLIFTLLLFTVIGFGLLIWRFNSVRATAAYGATATVDFFVSVGVLAFLIGGVLVTVGMSTPLWTRLGGTSANVTLDYYFLATTPIALIILFALSAFPFLRWIKSGQPLISRRAAIPFALAMSAGGAAILLGMTNPLYVVLIILGTMATTANGWMVIDQLRRHRILPGAYIAHVGIALLFIGAAVSSAYEKKERVPLPLGEPVSQFGWVLTYEGRDLSTPDGKTPYRIRVERPGTDIAYIATPRQFELPGGQGVMRKPAVKSFWNKDLYISPLDEVGGDADGAIAVLHEGQVTSVGDLTLTFLGFEMDGGHGEGAATVVRCPIEVTTDMLLDTLVPVIENSAKGLARSPVQFADDRYSLTVERIDAGGGVVEVRLIDTAAADMAQPVFWIEIAEKPLINLFWLGTWLMVIGGLIAMRKRRRQMAAPTGKAGSVGAHADEAKSDASVGASPRVPTA